MAIYFHRQVGETAWPEGCQRHHTAPERKTPPHVCVCVCGADVCVCLCVCVSEREGIKKYVYNITRSELASLALSLYVCLSGMDDIIIMHLHCTVPRALTVLYCICSDLQFMFIRLASSSLVG